MMKLQTLNRFHAFGWHLLISIAVALLSSSLVFLLWYPGLLALASGVRDIFLLLLLVDVTLGPVITLIIFNPQKKELKYDLMIVAAVQLAALLYGLHTVYVARPAYMVFTLDRFDLVYANLISEKNLDKVTKAEFQSLPLFGPKVVAVRRPDDIKAQNEILFGSLSGGDDLPQMPQYYIPYAELKADVIKRTQTLTELKNLNKDKSSIVDALVAKYASTKIDVGYLPLKGKAKDLVVIVDRQTGEILEMADLAPWR
ncbi:MAG: TfpX/TfpZ family type IV pilin accessory protein [Pseudomonadota bacterium]